MRSIIVYFKGESENQILAAIQWDGMTLPSETVEDYAVQYDFDPKKLSWNFAPNVPQPKPRKK